MQATPENINGVASTLQATINPDRNISRQAEAFLTGAKLQKGYGIILLKVVEGNTFDQALRMIAAVNFKNLVKQHWKQDDNTEYVLAEDDKESIKGVIVELMLSVQGGIRKQLAEGLTLISASDFPAKWPTLLPKLVSHLASPDVGVMIGTLCSIHGLTKRYRSLCRSDELFLEIKFVLDHVHNPLLHLFQTASGALEGAAGNKAQLEKLLQTLLLCSRIFYSLNSQDLPEIFEDNLSNWMTVFHKFLAPTEAVTRTLGEDKDHLQKLQTCTCQCLQLYMERYEEEFANFLQTFVSNVWNLLVTQVQTDTSFDKLACSAITFLSCVAKGVGHKLFESPDIMKSICEKVAVPNIQFRESDEELMEDNPQEYIRRDLEGSDNDTRRRATCELVKALCVYFEAPVTELCMHYVQAQLALYAQNPVANWASKDSAICLVIALAAKQSLQDVGAVVVNPHLNLGQFFATQILPELQSIRPDNVDQLPALKSSLLKFIIVFRSQLPRESLAALMPTIVVMLGSSQYIVHTYAAYCLERVMSLKDNKILRFGKAEIRPFLPPLLQALGSALDHPCSTENEHILKALNRIITTSQEEIAPLVGVWLEKLVGVVKSVCTNPKNPVFGYYLFETLAAIIRFVLKSDLAALAHFDSIVYGVLLIILQSQIAEFTPYVLQLIAMCIERSPILDPAKMELFNQLLRAENWDNRNNIPANIRVIVAVLEKNGAVTPQILSSILGIVQKLIGSKATDTEGVSLLCSVFRFVPAASIDPMLPAVLSMLFARYSSSPTPKYNRQMIVFMSLVAVQRGPDELVRLSDEVAKAKGAFFHLFSNVWVQHASQVADKFGRRVTGVATCKLLTESSTFIEDASYLPAWNAGVEVLATIVANQAAVAVAQGEEEVDEIVKEMDNSPGFSAAFSPLHNASRPYVDPCPQLPDVKTLFGAGVKQCQARFPGKLEQIVATLQQQSRQHFDKLLA